jgi:autoinducer 2 (AI-2) kinase
VLAIGVDIGSGGVRAAIYGPDGAQISGASRPWSVTPLRTDGLSYDLDATLLLQLAFDCVQRAIQRYGGPPEAVSAVSFTGFRDGLVAIDAEGCPVWAYSNLDRRRPAWWVLESELEQHARWLSGHKHPGSAAGHLAWLKEVDPLSWRRIARVLPLHDWIASVFGSEMATTPSSAGSFGVYDVRAHAWSDRLASELGLPFTYLPDVAEPFTSTGRVGTHAAAESGLSPGTLIVAAGADIHVAMLGLGALQPGDLALLGGSFWQTALVAASDGSALPSARFSEHPSSDLWVYELSSSTVGLSCRSLMQAFYGCSWREYEIQAAVAEFAERAGFHGIVVDLNEGRLQLTQRLPVASLTSREIGLMMIGSLLEWGVHSVAENVRTFMRYSDTSIDRLLVGGGVTQSRAVCDFLAGGMPLPILFARDGDSSLRGAAMCAFLGMGAFSSLEKAAEAMVPAGD